jgi:hypothetical protein
MFYPLCRSLSVDLAHDKLTSPKAPSNVRDTELGEPARALKQLLASSKTAAFFKLDARRALLVNNGLYKVKRPGRLVFAFVF